MLPRRNLNVTRDVPENAKLRVMHTDATLCCQARMCKVPRVYSLVPHSHAQQHYNPADSPGSNVARRFIRAENPVLFSAETLIYETLAHVLLARVLGSLLGSWISYHETTCFTQENAAGQTRAAA